MPRMRATPGTLPPIAEDDEVEAAPRATNLDPRKGDVGDPTGPGRWFETTTKDGSIGGTCAKCGRKRRANNLELTQLPFGQGEVWACRGGC